ncbi:alpha/beta hydrolase [Bradyrhizobium sp. AUGA SZCCT0222]|nr:alpha/beta hydrolase [Bradyrhizobium sp. AUGA SZCCT0222]
MVWLKSAVVAVTLVVACFQPASTQQSPMPEEVAAKLQQLGRVVDASKTGDVYAPLQEKEPYQGVKIERDIKYGADDRNLLDVFAPESRSSPRAILIYIHGGGFVRGPKRASGSPFNDNVMLWAVRNGYIGINAIYRLAPNAIWPSGAEDLAAAVQWVSDNIGARGGEPARIYMMGHSAGAVHVADYVSRPEFHKVKGGGLAGAILVSGIYDMPATSVNDYRVYFGTNASQHAEQSSLSGLLTTKTPLMVVAAELDPPGFVQQFELLKQASCKRLSGCSRAVMLPQHSHMSEVYSINTADTRLTGEIIDFMNTGK